MATFDFLPLCWGPPRMQGLLFSSALSGAPEKAGLTLQFRPLWAPREGRAEVVFSRFPSDLLDPPTIQGLRSHSTLFWAPEKGGVG